MHFPARQLKPYAEPVSPEDLSEGRIYFSLTFADPAMLNPTLEPLVFIGRDLAMDDRGALYFQDLDSYRRGIRFSDADQAHEAVFIEASAQEINHVFEFEKALDVLLLCSLRRSRAGPPAEDVDE